MVDYGVYDASDATSLSIPLEQVHVHADIIEDSAVVTVTQEFWQPYTSMTTAKYAFPTPAYAAVCGFKMFAEDGTTITAVAKEKSEAKKTFDRAVATGQTAGVLEHVRDDVFTISLGALPAHRMIKFQLTYAIDLTDVKKPDRINFRIPYEVGYRYGALPDGMVGASQVPSDRFILSANIYSARVVTSVTSSSHPQAEGLMASGGKTRVYRKSVSFHSSDFISKDFSLSITMAELELVSRCLVQTNNLGAMTMRTTIAPPPEFPQISQGQEYIFLVDRSGSMEGASIKIARTALALLLRALPDHRTFFNIVSFGDHCQCLWEQSQLYNDVNIKCATQDIMLMEADLGGTDIFFALGEAFKRRNIEAPTACFVITDGAVWDLDDVVKLTHSAVAGAAPSAPLRVFTLGIGKHASSALCTRVARAGNGVCLMAPDPFGMIETCATLIDASKSLPLYADVSYPGHTPLYVAAEPLLPGRRALIYSVAEPEGGNHNHPEYLEITLRDGNNALWRTPETVPVRNLNTDSLFPGLSPHEQRLLGILAARHVIAAIQHLNPPERQYLITRIGLTYQLATDFTSFVAVDQLNQTVDYYQQPAIQSDSDDFKPAQSVYSTRPAISSDPNEWTIEELLISAGWESRGAGQASTKAAHTDQMELPTMSDQELPSIDEPSTLCTSAWPSEEATQVALMQATDGHFEVSPDLEKIIGEDLFAEAERPDSVSETVWATVLAVAYLKKYMENVPVYLRALVEKAVKFLQGKLEDEVAKQLLEDAECLIGRRNSLQRMFLLDM